MIGVKAFKPASQQQPKREDYAEPEQEKKSIVPLAFLLFLTGCAAYLKSFLPVKAEEQKPQPSNKLADDAGQTESKTDGEVSAVTEEAVADQEATTAAADPVTKASDNVVPFRFALPQEAGAFPVSGSAPVEPAPRFSPRVATGAAADAVRAGENPPARANSGDEGGGKGGGGSGGGGSGGGGGGGGEDDKQRKSRGPDPDPLHNRAPRTSGPVHLQDLVGNQVLMLSMLTLLGGATDADGSPLGIANVSSSSGTLTRTEDGWMFVVDEGMVGDVTLTYTITDGATSVVQTARFSVVDAPSIIGTAADDSLLGTQQADTIDGGAGNDTIYARQGNDTIMGGSGDDTITAGAGDDIVHAGAGNDTVFAGPGNDVVYGGSGNDRLFGEDGDDTILGEEGDDLISGGAGNDILSDGAGRDTVQGGAGTDRVVAAADAANDTYDGGEGQDTLDYSAATRSITVDLGDGTAGGLDIGRDLVSSFETVIAGAGDDHLVAGSTSASMSGGDGNDTIRGNNGNDRLDGGTGNDALDGGAGADSISDGTGSDTVHGGGGNDNVVAAADAADDTYNGGAGQDTLDYSTASHTITVDLGNGTAGGLDIGQDLVSSFEAVIAGAGDDHLVAGSTSASMSGGEGNDTLQGNNGNDRLDGGAGNDVLSDGAGSDIVRGAGGDDHVVAAADAADDSYDGGAGQDELDYSTATLSITVDLRSGTADGFDIGHDLIAAFEDIVTGSGDDHLIAGSRSVSMTGGDGEDTFEFQRANDDQETMTVRKITDFTVGDRIVAATYEITYLQGDGSAADQISDMFSDIYLSSDDDNRPVRFRFEEQDTKQFTLVDVHDRPGTDDFFTIELDGHHQLQFTITGA